MKIIDGFRLRRIGTEYMVIGEGLGQVDFNKIISLSSSAAWLWEQIEGKTFDADTLTELLTKNYEVDEQVAHADAEDILNEWTKAKIIK